MRAGGPIRRGLIRAVRMRRDDVMGTSGNRYLPNRVTSNPSRWLSLSAQQEPHTMDVKTGVRTTLPQGLVGRRGPGSGS